MWRENVAWLSFIFISLSAIWKQISIIIWIKDEISEYYVLSLNFPELHLRIMYCQSICCTISNWIPLGWTTWERSNMMQLEARFIWAVKNLWMMENKHNQFCSINIRTCALNGGIWIFNMTILNSFTWNRNNYTQNHDPRGQRYNIQRFPGELHIYIYITQSLWITKRIDALDPCFIL